jgi:hypothetical protein
VLAVLEAASRSLAEGGSNTAVDGSGIELQAVLR